jgi:hypothetical protein
MITCSIARQEVKRRTRSNPGPSGVFRRPQWKPRSRGSKEYVMTGDEIERPLKFRWRISLGESGGNGNGRRQWYICTVSYWDVVDDRYGKEKKGKLFFHARKRLEMLFPDRDQAEIRDLLRVIEKRFASIRKSIIAEYQESEEYYFRLIQNLVEQKRRESDRRGNGAGKGAETRSGSGSGQEKAAGNRTQSGHHRRPGGESGASARGGTGRREKARPTGADGSAARKAAAAAQGPSDLDMALDLLQTGFRRVAAKYHPDTGGDTDQMQRLNLVRDRLERLCKQAFGKPGVVKGRG